LLRRRALTTTSQCLAHGGIIELDEDLGVVEGQEVEVQVKMVERLRVCALRARDGSYAERSQCAA
jgi:hypothetical protein